MKSDAQTERGIKQRFEMGEKILNSRQKYYTEYAQCLTQRRLQRGCGGGGRRRRRMAQKGPRKGFNHAGKPKPGRFQGQPMQHK